MSTLYLVWVLYSLCLLWVLCTWCLVWVLCTWCLLWVLCTWCLLWVLCTWRLLWVQTFPIYYHAKSEGPSSKIGWAIAIWKKCANFPRSRRWRRRRTNLSTILLDLMTIYSWERGTINWSCKKFYLVYYCWRGYKV